MSTVEPGAKLTALQRVVCGWCFECACQPGRVRGTQPAGPRHCSRMRRWAALPVSCVKRPEGCWATQPHCQPGGAGGWPPRTQRVIHNAVRRVHAQTPSTPPQLAAAPPHGALEYAVMQASDSTGQPPPPPPSKQQPGAPPAAAAAAPPKQPRKPYVLTKAREKWQPDEHARFLHGVHVWGREWRKIEGALFVPGRWAGRRGRWAAGRAWRGGGAGSVCAGCDGACPAPQRPRLRAAQCTWAPRRPCRSGAMPR